MILITQIDNRYRLLVGRDSLALDGAQAITQNLLNHAILVGEWVELDGTINKVYRLENFTYDDDGEMFLADILWTWQAAWAWVWRRANGVYAKKAFWILQRHEPYDDDKDNASIHNSIKAEVATLIYLERLEQENAS